MSNLKYFRINLDFLVITILIFLALGNSCKKSQKSKEVTNTEVKNDQQPENNKQPEKELVRLKISFISIGSGINFKAHDRFKAAVKEFEAQQKVTLTYTTKPWGREGEVSYCFPEQNKLQDFLKFIQKEMSAFDRVQIQENVYGC